MEQDLEVKKEARGNRFFVFISIIGFLGIFSTTISKSPVLPLFVKNGLGASDATLGLIAFFSPLAGMIFSFPIGTLMDRLGFKKMIWASAFFFVAAPLMYLLVNGPYLLIPIRFFHGTATAILMPVVTAAIAFKYDKNKAEKLGTFSSATLVGRTIAPAVGGFIISYLAFQHFLPIETYKAVYIAAFIASLPIPFLVNMIDDEEFVSVSGRSKISVADFGLALKRFVSNNILLSTALVEMAIYFCYGVLDTFLPEYLEGIKFKPSHIGIIFSIQIVAIALSKPFFGKIADKVNKRIQIITGIILVGASLYSITLFQNFWLIAIFSIFFGMGIALATVATSTHIADIVQKTELGSSMGALSSIMDIGQSTGPLIVGVLITTLGSISLGFLVATILCIFVAIYFLSVNFKTANLTLVPK